MNYAHIFRLSLQMTTALMSFYFYSFKSAIAGQENGITFFNHPPTLQRSALHNSGAKNSAAYEFTLDLPMNAGEPLQAVTIAQNPNFETVAF